MKLFACIISLSIAIAASAADNDIEVALKTDSADRLVITNHLRSYTQGIKTVEASLAWQYYLAGKFRDIRKTNNDYINDGLINKKTWFAFSLTNNSSTEKREVLECISSIGNQIKCYTVSDEELHLTGLFGDNKDYDSKYLSAPVAFNINIPPSKTITILLHVVNNGELLYIPTYLYSAEHFRKYEDYKTRFFGVFEGIFLFIIFFNLIIYFATQDRVYLLYLLYAFFVSLFALNEAGSAFYLAEFIPLIDQFSGQAFLLTGFSAWLLLTLTFLDLRSVKRLLFITRALVVFDLIWAFTPLLHDLLFKQQSVLFQTLYQRGNNGLLLCNVGLILLANTIRIRQCNHLGLLYALANIPVVIGTILFYTNYYGLTNIHYGWSNPIAIGLSIETFFISFGFAYRYYNMGKEREVLLSTINKSQKEITTQIVNVQEEEQKRIAQDLHDELGGDLAAIKMTLQSFNLPTDQSAMLTTLIDKTYLNARHIAHNLMPPEFDTVKLQDLLRAHYELMNKESSVRFEFICLGTPYPFSKDKELVIYRILSELANNILKHANATQATVQLLYQQDSLQLNVEDNGIGFKNKKVNGMGLKNIQSRVGYLDAEMNIDTGSSGTTIIIQIPYQNE